MNKLLIGVTGLVLVIISVVANAQNGVGKPIVKMFDAMRAHDAASLRAQFTSNAQLQRLKSNGAIVNNDIDKFALAVSKSTKYLDEQLLAIKTHQSDNLASAWTPYVFYIDGEISHCGVNSFQLVKVDKQWKIQYLIDNVHSGDCKAFIASHKS